MLLNQYVGIPYCDKGRNIEIGVDCWGLVRIIYEDVLKIGLPSYLQYSKSRNKESVSAVITNNLNTWTKIVFEEKHYLDVVLFNIFSLPCHVAITIDAKHFIHSRSGCNVVIEKFNDPFWVNRVNGIYRCNN